MPVWLQAGGWGLLAGGALVVGALVAWFVRVPRTVVATVMAFGAGVLISALAFDLVAEAESTGGLGPTLIGFLGGAVTYVAANIALARHGARHRKRSGDQQPSEREQQGSGTAIAIGALLDGVPESVVLGLTLLAGQGVGIPVLAAIFISNLPEGLSSAAGMKRAGRSAGYVFGVWCGIAVLSGAAGALGVLLHLFFFRRLASFSSATALIGSLALSIVITATIQTIAGPRPERLPIAITPGTRIGDAFVTRTQIYVVAIAAVVFLVLFTVLSLTTIGRAVRSVAANPELAAASGIDVKRVSTAVVFVAAALAATGGVLIATDTSISLDMGSALLLATFAAVIMGGIGSVGGALLASAVLALAESAVLRIDFGPLVGADSLLVPVDYRPAVGFVAVILVMLFRPQGLFGFGGRRA